MTPETSKILDESLSKRLEKRGFSPLGRGAERHGSWEWAFLKRAEGLNRFVFVALTNLTQVVAQEPLFYIVEVWAGADDDSRFVKRLTGEWRAHEIHLRQGLPETFGESLERAMREAEHFKATDLTDAYLPSRVAR